MVKLRGYFDTDLQSMIHPDEFAEEIKVDGKSMQVILDNDLLKEYKLKNGGEGLEQIELLFHVDKSYFDRKPSTNHVMRIEQRIYQVADATEEEGMYTITLARNQS